jgi:hypothetical protein
MLWRPEPHKPSCPPYSSYSCVKSLSSSNNEPLRAALVVVPGEVSQTTLIFDALGRGALALRVQVFATPSHHPHDDVAAS